LETEQTRRLHDERSILQSGESGADGVAAVGVHDEQIAAGLVLPAEPQVGGKRGVGGVVLNQRTERHAGAHREVHARADESSRKPAYGKVNPVERDTRLERELRGHVDTSVEAD